MHILLRNNIQHAFDDGKLLRHANYTSVIQGSGSGKSRMVKQLALVVFSLDFNLRHSVDTKNESMALVSVTLDMSINSVHRLGIIS